MDEPKARCKFRCDGVRKYLGFRWKDGIGSQRFLYAYDFSVVTGGSPENDKFYASTPSGTVIVGAVAEDLFEPGKEYYLDFTPVPVG